MPREAILARREAFHASVQSFVERAEAGLAALLREELRPVIARYEMRKAAAGQLDFFDLLRATRDLARDQPLVRAGLQKRFTHLLTSSARLTASTSC